MTVSQDLFHGALLDAAHPVPEGLTDGQGQPAGRRFAVYRNNVASSLTDALELSFPAIQKLIGDENFRKIAGIFLRQHPPSTPMLSQYGAEMPSFLEGFAPLAHIPYLADVARLEQAIRLSYHAADSIPADPSLLQDMAPEGLATTRFQLAPSLRVVRSRYPVHAIWAYNLEGGPKPEAVAQCALILRAEFDPEPNVITAATADFIEALEAGATLGDANEAALATDPDFDLSAALSLLLSGQAITHILPETGP